MQAGQAAFITFTYINLSGDCKCQASRSQANSTVERFRRTLDDDLIEGATFEYVAEFNDALPQCLPHYYTERLHQDLHGHTTIEALQIPSTNCVPFAGMTRTLPRNDYMPTSPTPQARIV